jgi:hypothetical protein
MKFKPSKKLTALLAGIVGIVSTYAVGRFPDQRETILSIAATVSAYILGQSHVDGKIAEADGKVAEAAQRNP